MTLGERLLQLRKDNGLSQESLAKMLYVTRQSISLWENDKAMPSIDLLMRLGSIFSVSVDELLDNPTPDTEKPVSKHTTVYSEELLYDAFKNESYLYRTIAFCVAIIYTLLGILLLSGAVNTPEMEVSPMFSMIPVVIGIFGILVAGGLCVFLIVLNTKMKDKANKLIGKNINKIEVLTFRHHIKIKEYGEQAENYLLPYTQISSVNETENYYIINLIDKNVIVADKNNTQGDVSYLAKSASLYHKHRNRCLFTTYDIPKLGKKKILITKYASIALCIASIISLWIAIMIATTPMRSGKIVSEFTAFESNFVKYTMLAFLLVPLTSIIFGAYHNSKGRRTKLNIIIGLVMFAIIGLLSLMFWLVI